VPEDEAVGDEGPSISPSTSLTLAESLEPAGSLLDKDDTSMMDNAFVGDENLDSVESSRSGPRC
jgi:hypothetical protein